MFTMPKWEVGKTCIYVIATCGSILMLAGVLLTLTDRDEYSLKLLKESRALQNGSDAWRIWARSPIPVLFKVYIWNVTNPAEVTAGAKPRLSELGPYVYEQWKEKENIKIEQNETLSYNPSCRLLFNDKLSGGRRENDFITIIHLPIMGMILRLDELMPEYVGYLDNVLSELFPDLSDIFMRGTVRDILFDGIPIDCSSKDFMVTIACNNLRDKPPKTIRKEGETLLKFSFFDYKRKVSSDVVREYRGTDDIRKLGKIFSFNNNKIMKTWNDKYCDMINGSDGSQMPMNLKPEDTIYTFQSEMCRSVYVKYEKELYRGNTKLYRYVITRDLFASAEDNPDNACFCAPKAKIGDLLGDTGETDDDTDESQNERTCTKSGAMLMTPCVGAPVILTYPHFYMADMSFSKYVQLSPQKELHETFVDVEPLSGIPFRGSKRIQFNIQVKPIPDIAYMNNLSSGLFPVLWVEESMELPEAFASSLSVLILVHEYINMVGFGCIGIASIILVGAGICYVKKNKTVSWGTEGDLEEIQNGVHGLYSNRMKVPFNISENANSEAFKTDRYFPDYPVIMKRNAGRVYPNPNSIYRENFM